MKEEQHQFLTLLGQLPARLTAEQAAWVLNCQPHDVPILVASRLLKPLGNPAPNAIKFFATADLLELLKDRSWLAKMTNVIGQYWRRKNIRKSISESPQRKFALSNLPVAAEPPGLGGVMP